MPGKPWRAILNPGIYAALLLTALLMVLAYQFRPTYAIQMGSATDGPLLRGFNAGETSQGAQPFLFRWTTADATITLQDAGRQDFDVVLSMGGGRTPGAPPAHVQVDAGGAPLLDVTLPDAILDYPFHVSRDDVRDGTLRLHLHSTLFTPQGDSRSLGTLVTSVRVAPGTAPDRFIEPPLPPLLYVLACVALLALAAALLGWGTGGVFLVAGALGLLAALLAAFDRLWLTSARWYEDWLTALIAGLVFVALFGSLLGWLLRRVGHPWTPLQRRILITLTLLVFAIRLAGQLNPQITIVDLIFHAHRFDTVRSGQLLFTIESAEWGGHSTFYLPTAYIFMLPLQWLLNNELLVIKLLTVTLSMLGSYVVFFVGRVTLTSGRAGLIASALYLTVPMAVLPFSWGITTNIFGEFFALLAFGVLVTMFRGLSPLTPAFAVLIFALLMALLSHPGVVQLTGVAFTFIALLWLLAGRQVAARRAALWLLAGLAAACVVAYVGYYGHFAASMITTLQQMQAERAQASGGQFHTKIGGSVADKSLGLIVQYAGSRSQWFFGGLRGFWQEAQAYYRVWPVAGAVLGYLAVWPVRLTSGAGEGRRFFVLAAAGWALTVLLFLLVGWVMNLYVRYSLFALPIIALGAGALLNLVWAKGRAGAWLTLMMLLFFAVEALSLWQYRINYAFK